MAAVPSAVTGEPDQAKAQLRSELIPYFSLPFYRKMIELSGFADDIAAFDRDGPGRRSPTSFLEPSPPSAARRRPPPPCAATPTAARPRPAIGGIARTDFDATLEALAGCIG